MAKWFPIKFVTWNFGPGKQRDLLNLLEFAWIVFLQEAGDRVQDIHEVFVVLRRRVDNPLSWASITGTDPGQASTPLLFNDDKVLLLKVSRILIAHSQDAGPGTGPRRIKEKWLIGGKFQDRASGRKFWAYSVHFVTSQGEFKRHRIALSMANLVALRIRSVALAIFIGGDWNNLESSDVMQQILKIRGMKATASLSTHGNWKPDRIIWRIRNWIRLMRTRKIENGSDHDAVVGEFEFKAKRSHA